MNFKHMKLTRFFTLLIALMTSGLVFAEEDAPSNVSCANAQRLCSTTSTAFVPNGTSLCVGGKVKLYYVFKASSTQTSGALLLTVGTGATTNTVKVFGPYNELLQGCEQFNLLAPPVISTAAATSNPINMNTVANQYYLVEVTVNSCSGTATLTPQLGMITCSEETLPCEDCIGTFQPTPGSYIFSCWVKEDQAPVTTTSYSNCKVNVVPTGSSAVVIYPSGPIIDGWQRIEGTFTVGSVGPFQLDLVSSGSEDVFFDDIRIFPFDGSILSYVYDPITLRLAAELDERNYAKFYEYDEEGKLVRVKKETENGIMTIEEHRNSYSGKP